MCLSSCCYWGWYWGASVEEKAMEGQSRVCESWGSEHLELFVGGAFQTKCVVTTAGWCSFASSLPPTVQDSWKALSELGAGEWGSGGGERLKQRWLFKGVHFGVGSLLTYCWDPSISVFPMIMVLLHIKQICFGPSSFYLPCKECDNINGNGKNKHIHPLFRPLGFFSPRLFSGPIMCEFMAKVSFKDLRDFI